MKTVCICTSGGNKQEDEACKCGIFTPVHVELEYLNKNFLNHVLQYGSTYSYERDS